MLIRDPGLGAAASSCMLIERLLLRAANPHYQNPDMQVVMMTVAVPLVAVLYRNCKQLQLDRKC